MEEGSLKGRIDKTMKDAMRAHAKERLATIRLIQAGIKQWEVDERISLNDEQVLSLLDKMIRQRKEAIKQFTAGNRQDLVDKETAEISVIQEFMPSPLSHAEIQELVKAAIQESGASTVRDMGRVMALLKSKLQGRADLAEVGNLVKELLAG